MRQLRVLLLNILSFILVVVPFLYLILIVLLVVILLPAITIYSFSLTNPFSKNSIVDTVFKARLANAEFVVTDNSSLIKVSQSFLFRQYAKVKSGYHIIANRWWSPGTASQSSGVKDIVQDIYKVRFNPKQPVLISADHFTMLYNRSFGIFYYSMLDTSINSTTEVWHNRQAIYLQSLAYALNTYEHTKDLTTTIVPTGKRRVTPVNFHSYPSDTMYSLLYALATTSGKIPASPYNYGQPVEKLQTVSAGQKLIDNHKAMLKRHYDRYKSVVHDKTTSLIKPELRLSGTKDITMRSNAFYDNVIFWRTTQLAMELGVIPTNQKFLDKTRSKIIKAFWREDKGYFLEDLSAESARNSYFSSDWLVVLNTGFLNPTKPEDLRRYERILNYLHDQKIDHPFGVKYHNDTRARRQFPIVRLVAASYGGDTIWSYWGMEYAKALLAVYRETGNKKYLKIADQTIESYRQKIEEYHGFPETYDRNGKMFETFLYRSMRQTGWVIGYDQVLSIRRTLD